MTIEIAGTPPNTRVKIGKDVIGVAPGPVTLERFAAPSLARVLDGYTPGSITVTPDQLTYTATMRRGGTRPRPPRLHDRRRHAPDRAEHRRVVGGRRSPISTATARSMSWPAARWGTTSTWFAAAFRSTSIARTPPTPVTRLLAGDFDGDRLGDVALVESAMIGDRLSVVFGARDGVLASAAPMSDFGGTLALHRLTSAPWLPTARGTDGIDDILVVRTDQSTARVGLSMGDAARILTTPRFPPAVNQVRDLGAVVAGRFGSPDVELLAIADATDPGVTILHLYDVRANMWAPELALMAEVRAPLGSLHATPQSFAVGVTGDAATPSLVAFNARSPMPACTSARMAAPRELRGVDIDRDGTDELAVYLGEGPTRTLELYAVCPFQRVAQLALEGCVDVANVGTRVYALCRGASGPARLLFELVRDGETFTRAAEPSAILDGDGRFLATGDFDGVLDLAAGLGLGAGINVHVLRQCAADDTRDCR